MAWCVWYTGLPASGKTTAANALRDVMDELGAPCHVLDGDELRQGLCEELGFSRADRTENLRRAAHAACLLLRQGINVAAAFVSPSPQDRGMARALVEAGGHRFLEVHVDTPLEVCEARDPKGLWKKARAGEIPDFTGVGAMYHAPARCELRLSHGLAPHEWAAGVMTLLTLRQPA